ncbi:MAG: 1-acyl-sn-glycerol-3-phosphate acyltransferase [Acidobacteriota bacterium]|nr:1-acyl-sn-glycerol-3-phosphate acyltransferase [Acidobacteriota bacterium]
MVQSLAHSTWECETASAAPTALGEAWHPRTLWTWGNALGRTAFILLRLGQAKDPSQVLSQWSRHLLRALHVEVELAAPIPDGAQIWVANHLSWLDPMVLMAQRPMLTLAKAEVADYPWLGRHARQAGLHFVDREDPLHRAAALLELVRRWRTGAPFLLFPEGTTTEGNALAPLYEGGLRAAFRLGLPVLPLRLESPDAQYPWTGEAALLPHLQALSRWERTRVSIHPGALLTPCGDEDAWLRRIRAHLGPHSNQRCP